MAAKLSVLLAMLLLMLLSMLLPARSVTAADDVVSVKHYQHEARYAFGLKLLDLALSKTQTAYKIHTPPTQVVNEGRGEYQVLTGELDLQWLLATPAREQSLIPIRIPIYRGILGLRLLLVSQERHPQLSQVRNLDDLRHYTGGHGKHWRDLPVFAANNMPVVTNVDYLSLFKQLAQGEFDYFHRGINEVWLELERHSKHLAVVDGLMLFYPNPVYFFVNKNRPELAKLIEKGLQQALSDGSYKTLFLEHHADMIARSKLASRRLIRLHNPTLSPYFPAIDTHWWLPEPLQKKLSISTDGAE